jgi:conserved oligomeric Golgi complex subunit 2
MSAKSPSPSLESYSRDPFQLQRLADELADDEDLDDELHDLPAYLPLSHDDPYLSAPIFDVEQFLLSRSYTSLPDLRLELRNYLAALKEELVQLINDDYEAFISLSTDLRDEGVRLEKLKWPLADLKGQTLVRLVLVAFISCIKLSLSVQASKHELEQLKTEIQSKLRKRSALREEKVLVFSGFLSTLLN